MWYDSCSKYENNTENLPSVLLRYFIPYYYVVTPDRLTSMAKKISKLFPSNFPPDFHLYEWQEYFNEQKQAES